MISTGQLIVILVVVLLLFGTKRLRNVGSDLGAAIKGFKKSLNEGEQEAQDKPAITQQDAQKPGERVIDNAAQPQDQKKS